MDLEFACGRVSKLLLDVVIDLGLIFFYKNFNSLLVDLFTLRIVSSNLPKVFTLKRFVLLVFLGDHIGVFFTFPLLYMI